MKATGYIDQDKEISVHFKNYDYVVPALPMRM